ncbi:MAG: HAD-IA family hydrolase [Pseudomonadota bacterium]
MPLPNLVIFDCDGVLVDTEARVNDLIAGILIRAGLPMTGTACRERFQGKSTEDLCREVSVSLGREIDHDIMQQEINCCLASGIEAVPGVTDLVERLIRLDIPVCVASSGTIGKMHITLGQTRLLPLLGDVLFSATSVARGKPAPDLFLHAAERMGHPPVNCVVIEDSRTGVLAGVAAGMRVLGYCGDPFTDPARLRDAGAEVFSDMRDAPSMLGLTAP